MNKNFNELLDRELSRREFLQFVGGGIIVLFGLQNFISYLSQFNAATPASKQQDASHGFGSRKFGN